MKDSINKDKLNKTKYFFNKAKIKILKFLKIILPKDIMVNPNSALVFKRLILFALLLFVLQCCVVSIVVFIVVKAGGKSFILPDVLNKEIYEAFDILEKENINLKVQTHYFSNFPLGTVVNQEPKGGVKIKEGRTVYLVINAPEQIILNMPDITGMKYEEAINIISNEVISKLPNIIINDIIELQDETNENDIILSQIPKANEIIKNNSEITLTVNKKNEN